MNIEFTILLNETLQDLSLGKDNFGIWDTGIKRKDRGSDSRKPTTKTIRYRK